VPPGGIATTGELGETEFNFGKNGVDGGQATSEDFEVVVRATLLLNQPLDASR
jgi:hypothetical protein